MTTTTAQADKSQLLNAPEFDAAIKEATELKKEVLTTWKTQNSSNYKSFCEVMYDANDEIKQILSKKRKDRTDSDIEKLKKFKADVAQMYKQTTLLISKEEIEDGKKSRAEKIVDKLIPVIYMLKYIDSDVISHELAKHGVSISLSPIENWCSGLASSDKKTVIKDIFASAKRIHEQVDESSQQIKTDIFLNKVPEELQYDKDLNSSGMKPGDFSHLVDLNANLALAASEAAKEKAEDKIKHAAGEEQFKAARACLVRDSLTALA